jgi:hypothetical protein
MIEIAVDLLKEDPKGPLAGCSSLGRQGNRRQLYENTLESGIVDCTACGLDCGLPHVLP